MCGRQKKPGVKITRSEEPPLLPSQPQDAMSWGGSTTMFTHNPPLCSLRASYSSCVEYVSVRNKSVKTDNLYSVMLPVLRTQPALKYAETFFSPTWIRQNRNYSHNNWHACLHRSTVGVMFKLRGNKLQRNFQITNHKLISFLASTCQRLGPWGLFSDAFQQLKIVSIIDIRPWR